MADETESKAPAKSEPPMNRHKPASKTTQDISHLLASIFSDLYTIEVIGKDTVSNLSNSCRGSNDYHQKYVEELQQVHSEYKRRMQNADMLEAHIIHARLQAAAREDHEHNKIMEEVGEAYHQLGLPPVKSAFKWCVDSELLRSNDLICPLDYTTVQTPVVKCPKGILTPGFAQPTMSHNMHICTDPQDDGYTPLPPCAHTAHSLLEQSEDTLTFPSSPESSSIKSTEFSTQKLGLVHKASWMEKPSAQSLAEDEASLQKHKGRHKFLRNPRFLLPNAQHGGKSLIMPGKRPENMGKGRKNTGRESSEGHAPIFTANPPVIIFTDYRVGQIYETVVELKNMTATSRYIRMIPPTSPHFSVGLGRFPGEGGIVAPGMSCQYMVRFAPDSLSDFEDVLVVETQLPYPLIIPIEARRPPPILTLPAVIDCGYCLAGGVKFMELLCRNEGLSAGTFCVMSKKQWPASSLRSAVKSTFAEQPPFAISPSIFGLLPGQATVIEIVFFPTTAEISSQDFSIVCDNCQVKDITLQGTGQLITVELVSVSGGEDQPEFRELCDVTADHFVRFNPTNPHATLQKTVVVKNNAHLELPYHWQFMKPNLQCLLPGEAPDLSSIQYHLDTDSVFSISPVMGILTAEQEQEFLLTYCPKDLKDYHSVCHLVIMDVPNPPRICADGTCLNTAVHVNDVTALEIEVKGSTEAYKILLEPYAVLIPGETYIHDTIRKTFKMWNHSRSVIYFEWERDTDGHVIEVEPSIGEIEMNECLDLELVLTGRSPGHFTSTLQCHVQHHPKTIGLAIEGPHCSVNVPSLDFGLLQMGNESISTINITNNSLLDAHWSLEEVPHNEPHSLVCINPNTGVLPPLTSCSVDVLFRALYCQTFESVLQLSVLHGTGCHLSVRAVVQSPQVCLLNCELVFADLYVGVPQAANVTLFNQTLLPANFTWSELQGAQAHLCSATLSPASGTLEPNAKTEVSVTFTAHTVEELTEVAAVCEVKGMERPLVLGFFSKAKPLRVSYSLPSDSINSGDAKHQPVTLDFTEHEPVVIGKSAKRQLLITNHTAIASPFTVEAEYFTGYCPSQSDEKSERSSAPLHSVQAKKIQQKAYDEFVSCLLSHGRGAAFFVEPNRGMIGPFESQIINITAFTNMWGYYQDNLICKVGNLDPTPIPVKIYVRGCPIYFQMIGPQPDNQNQGPIIRFGSHVSGGDTVSRSLRLINTSSYDIRLDWVTYNLEVGDNKLIDLLVACGEPFPLKDADGNEVVGGLDSSVIFPATWDDSHTASREGTSSTLMTKSDDFGENEEECDGEEDSEASVSQAPVKKLFSVFLKPHEGNVSDYPYCITPQQTVVPAGGSSTIHLSFTPLILSCSTNQRCLGYALGFMTLDSKLASLTPGKVERAQGYELEPLRLDMQANVKPAILSVQMAEDSEILEFSTAASDTLDAGSHTQKESRITRTFQLKNNSDMALSFRLSTKPPFSVLLPRQSLKTISSSPAHRHTQGLSGPGDEQTSLLLQPKHIMQVKVAFHNSSSLLACLNEPCEESDAQLSATLLCSNAGDRTLQFQQSLTIQYSNNSVQTVPLCARLALPTLHLSCSMVDFGTCYVGQTTVKEIYLYNRGGSCSYWTMFTDAEGGDEVFTVSPHSGVLKPLGDPPSCKQLLQISFTASAEKEFQTRVTVQGFLGETPLVLKVNGRGSFDESFVSPISDTSQN